MANFSLSLSHTEATKLLDELTKPKYTNVISEHTGLTLKEILEPQKPKTAIGKSTDQRARVKKYRKFIASKNLKK